MASATAEVASATAEVASATAEVVSATAEVVSATAEVVSATAEVVSATAEVVSATAEVVSATAEVVSATAEVVSATQKIALGWRIPVAFFREAEELKWRVQQGNWFFLAERKSCAFPKAAPTIPERLRRRNGRHSRRDIRDAIGKA